MSSTAALDQSAILANAKLDNLRVTVFNELDSTNTWMLARRIMPGTAELCITEVQTLGRGRRGNQWYSAPHKNIMFSLGWSFQAWPQAITGLSLAMGMVIAEQLNIDFGLDVKVKWPNDLMVGNAKLGGILIELVGDPAQACQVVVGVGLNVHQPTWSRESSDYPWQDLNGLGIEIDRNILVAKLARELVSSLIAFEREGFAKLVNVWPEFSSYQGRQIYVDDGQTRVTGKMTGVDEQGALMFISDNNIEHRFTDSNVSIRLLN